MVTASETTIGVSRRSPSSRLRLAASSFYEILDAMGRCWFLFVATLAVGLILVFVPQGREALWAAGTTGHELLVWVFFVTSISGAVLVTLFASQILESGSDLAIESSPARCYACFAVPGFMGLLAAFLVPILIERMVANHPFLLPQRQEELRKLGILFQALALPAIVLARCPKVLPRAILLWRSDRRQVFSAIGLLAIFVLGLSLSHYPFVAGTLVLFGGLALLDTLWWQTGLESTMRRWRKWTGFLLATGWIAAGCWVAAEPETRAPAIGPASLILFAEFFWLGVAYVLFRALGRWLSQGILIALLIAVTLLFVTGPFNLRSVRTITHTAASAATSHQSALSMHVDNWLEARRVQIEAAAERYPVFVASAEGGGIRAACWTAGILCAIQDAQPEFADHLLGISGVSGGSLGAATFVALVRESHLGNLKPSQGNTSEMGALQGYADRVLSRDFLSPVLATMLIPDVAACLFHNHQAEDRASALERAFEISWRQAVRTNTFEEPLNALWGNESRHRVPALFLNSTQFDTGRRIVNSHVVFDADHSPALSLGNTVSADLLRVSTAVLLSARFPAISPIGSIGGGSNHAPVYIVDGGYVDNSGTLTAAEVVTALASSADRLGLRNRIRIVAIVITDDPIVTNDEASGTKSPYTSGLEGTAAGALLSPLETLDNVRQALSKRHREAFNSLVHASGGEVLDGFALRASRIEFPVGWMLSSATRAALTQQIEVLRADPQSDFKRVRSLLSPASPPSK